MEISIFKACFTPEKCQLCSNVVFEKEISIWEQKTPYFNQKKLSTFFSGIYVSINSLFTIIYRNS